MKAIRVLYLTAIALLIAMVAPLQAQNRSSAQLQQGEIAKWDEFDAAECGIAGERYPAIEGTCYFPVHFTAEPGLHEIAIYTKDGEAEFGWLQVKKVDYPNVRFELEDESLVDLEGEQLQQHFENRQELRQNVFGVEPTEPRFTLPLVKPTDRMPRSEDDFGSIRQFNDSDAESQHSGRDYPVGDTRTVSAPADGTVLLSTNHLLTGNAVYLDHGAGLVTMFFHLSGRAVETGDEVKQGDPVGEIGETGRTTGPHLHFGARWVDQVIDPAFLLDDPSGYATVGPDGGTAGTAGRSEPQETGESSETDEPANASPDEMESEEARQQDEAAASGGDPSGGSAEEDADDSSEGDSDSGG